MQRRRTIALSIWTFALVAACVVAFGVWLVARDTHVDRADRPAPVAVEIPVRLALARPYEAPRETEDDVLQPVAFAVALDASLAEREVDAIALPIDSPPTRASDERRRFGWFDARDADTLTLVFGEGNGRSGSTVELRLRRRRAGNGAAGIEAECDGLASDSCDVGPPFASAWNDQHGRVTLSSFAWESGSELFVRCDIGADGERKSWLAHACFRVRLP